MLLTILLFLVATIITFFWISIINLTHINDKIASAYNMKELSKVNQLKVNIHLAMCFECQNLIDQPKEELPLEEHLVNPNE